MRCRAREFVSALNAYSFSVLHFHVLLFFLRISLHYFFKLQQCDEDLSALGSLMDSEIVSNNNCFCYYRCCFHVSYVDYMLC